MIGEAMSSTVTEERTVGHVEQLEKLVAPQAAPRTYTLKWSNIVQIAFFHLCGLYGLYLCFTSAKWQTLVFTLLLYCASIMGVTAGAHRLWSHRSYKARLPLQILLMLFHTLSYQDTALHWARDHRMHHKYTDTDADPYNATRGLFYSHVGWLVVRKHPDVIRRAHTIDWKDIADNPVLKFQTKYFIPLALLVTFVLPISTPIYLWGETFANAFHISFLRLICSLHAIFLVNSAAHKFGYKPYDAKITSSQSAFLSWINLGESFHNYHHVFPFDYRAGEFGNNCLNLCAIFIDFFAWIGWAYDLKTASDDMIMKRAKRSGDGTDLWGRENKNFKDMPEVNEEIASFNDMY